MSALPIVLMALGLYFSHDELRKPYVLSNYYSSQKRWDKILELAERLPKGRNNLYVNHDILRALYHTGRLPYDMFRFPLVPEALLLTHEKRESDLTQWKLSDMFLELGHVNMAQKLASELVATKGHLGAGLEELAWISIIKGQPATARVYLEALKRDLDLSGQGRVPAARLGQRFHAGTGGLHRQNPLLRARRDGPGDRRGTRGSDAGRTARAQSPQPDGI